MITDGTLGLGLWPGFTFGLVLVSDVWQAVVIPIMEMNKMIGIKLCFLLDKNRMRLVFFEIIINEF